MSPPLAPSPLGLALLHELATAPGAGGMSLPRLGKRLGQGVSALLRELTMMSEARVGGRQGPGWVRVVQLEERWVAHLTPLGRAQLTGTANAGSEAA